jgi:hypothetical protein
MNKACFAAITIFVLGCRLNVPPEKELPDAEVIIDVAAPDTRLPACMTDPTYTARGEHRYKSYPTPSVDYDTAIDRCAADGAHLVVIDSVTENEQAKGLISGDTWIGLDDLTVDNDFHWVTGATSTFRSFSTGVPAIKEDDDCVFFGMDGKWDVTGCATAKRVLCECDPAYEPPPTPLCRQLGGYTIRGGRRYFVRQTPATWQAAEDDCTSMGAHLAVIGDTYENTQLDMAFLGPSWIGYTDAATDGVFQWVNGSPSTYQRFFGSAPSNDAEDCTALLDGGLWDDRPCDSALPYACECDPLPP